MIGLWYNISRALINVSVIQAKWNARPCHIDAIPPVFHYYTRLC